MKTKGLLILALVAMSYSVSAQAWRQQYTNMTGSTTYVDQISYGLTDQMDPALLMVSLMLIHAPMMVEKLGLQEHTME
jgi:hypothetical protein